MQMTSGGSEAKLIVASRRASIPSIPLEFSICASESLDFVVAEEESLYSSE